jgi:hypothetical protein
MSATPRPETFAPFFRVLAEIAREQAIERRKHLRLIIEVASEIEHDEPPPPPLRTGVEMRTESISGSLGDLPIPAARVGTAQREHERGMRSTATGRIGRNSRPVFRAGDEWGGSARPYCHSPSARRIGLRRKRMEEDIGKQRANDD